MRGKSKEGSFTAAEDKTHCIHTGPSVDLLSEAEFLPDLLVGGEDRPGK